MFLCGSDEYGTAITIQADREHTTPLTIVDKYHTEHEKTFRSLQIDFDIFSRTTNRNHSEDVAEFFLDLLEKGFLEKRKMISPFCLTCNRFMPDRYIAGTCPNCGSPYATGDQCDECGKILDPQELIDPRCIISGDTPEFRETEHLFFLLDRFSSDLEKWLNTKDFWKPHVLQFSKGLITTGLKARPITRDIDWGVPVPIPGYENKRLYVWFENLIGYVSAAREVSAARKDPDLWKKFWLDSDTRTYYFMGKDNITFHTIIWPSMLIGRGGWNLPYDVPANEYLRFDGERASKSRGIGFTVDSVLKHVDSNYLRFYLASILPENGDSNFSVEEMQEKVNSELISKYGNLLHRVISFITSHNIELGSKQRESSDLELLLSYSQRFVDFSRYLDNTEIKKALHLWVELVQEANAYLNRSEPWKLVKTDREKCAGKLYTAMRLLQYLTVMIYPYIPEAAEKCLKIMGYDGSMQNAYRKLNEESNFKPEVAEVPFRKLEISDINPNPLNLVVGRILSVENHPDADRLYVMKVSLGDHEIQLVAGLRKHYRADQLENRLIIVVANLKRGRFRGLDSEGMLLAADDGTSTHFLTVDSNTSPGSSVSIGPYAYNGTRMVTIEDLQKYNLQVSKDGGIVATINGKDERLLVTGNPVKPETEAPPGSRVR